LIFVGFSYTTISLSKLPLFPVAHLESVEKPEYKLKLKDILEISIYGFVIVSKITK